MLVSRAWARPARHRSAGRGDIEEGAVGIEVERAAGAGAAVLGHGDALDLRQDIHVHTGFAAGRDAVGVLVAAADRAGLSALTFADQVGPDTAWLPAYADAVRRARRRTELTLTIAAEVEVVRCDGWLAWPDDLGDVDAVSVAVSRLPLAGDLLEAREVRAALTSGRLAVTDVAEIIVGATVRGLARAARYAPVQLARPLSLLTQIGMDDTAVSADLLAELVAGCRETNALVEISEAWRSPSARLVRHLGKAGVSLGAASDARYAAEVGAWQYLRGI
jgi:histidinol phosphatase-like PHP family hydrolase